MARNVAATPISPTRTPPSSVPRGIAAQAPPRTAPKTRPRRWLGTISVVGARGSRLLVAAANVYPLTPSQERAFQRLLDRALCE